MRKRFVWLALFGLLLGLTAVGLANWRNLSSHTSAANAQAASAPANSPGVQAVAEVTRETNKSATDDAPVANAGRKVFVDPITGKTVPPPPQAPGVVLPLPADHALSTSGEGLREVPVTTRGGGVKVHLQGRFRSTVKATVGSDGKLTTRCVTEPEAESRNSTEEGQ